MPVTEGPQQNTQPAATPTVNGVPACHHCGLPCDTTDVEFEGKHFCCNGCKAVYELLTSRDLCAYYDLNETPGATIREDDEAATIKWGFLDHDDVKAKLLEFSDGGISKATFTVPHMHCASCIYILEELSRLHAGVVNSRVNFLRKQVTVTWRDADISLRGVVQLLSSIGYEPRIQLEAIDRKEHKSEARKLLIQLGIAGFAFGNIMLMSFPEYLTFGGRVEPFLANAFGYLNMLLALPVVFYSANGYLSRAWKGLRAKTVNLDVPISLGVLALFLRSSYEVIFNAGSGYFDSLAGLVFLLLVGRYIQERTYAALSFDRDYRSYFPLAVMRRDGHGDEQSIPVTEINVGDRIVVRKGELIPADSILIEGDGDIDYSFVTGESDPVRKESGDVIYAGGRQTSSRLEMEVIEEVSRSYLVRLWNQDAANTGPASRFNTLTEKISGWFTGAVLAIATIAALFWVPSGVGHAIYVFTAVLIVACPCALALATPFTLGTAMRILGGSRVYLKRASVVETLARITHVVFDKTGTLTETGGGVAGYQGEELNEVEQTWVRSLVYHSTHPISMKVNAFLHNRPAMKMDEVHEVEGKGLHGRIAGYEIKLGSAEWVGVDLDNTPDDAAEHVILKPRPFAAEEDPAHPVGDSASRTFFSADGEQIPSSLQNDAPGNLHSNNTATPRNQAWVSIDGQVKGVFTVQSRFRPGMDSLLNTLAKRIKLSLLSGDNDRERHHLAQLFPDGADLRFQQEPFAKRDRVRELQESGEHVLMVGDGLNDAGALDAADIGLVVSQDVTGFSPACDALMDQDALRNLDKYIEFSRASTKVIIAAFVISFAYNLTGLGFAVAGMLSPLVSAIIMPISSISVIVFTTLLTQFHAARIGVRR
ncbi:heavy metal translocating P-type ATPase metal-binding domain-containing protein [bacterium]|nr:heavy metal translocating P-type ATPase metal-binding domain-containing protein [bacterium]